MGSVAAIRILHKRTLAGVPAAQLHAVEAELAAGHEATIGGLNRAVEVGVVDEIISPAETASAIVAALAAAPIRRGQHKNIPL
jgi:acetyl-CoA/propionyl-CoA carboxylase carboxyl transferase subunit